MAITAIASAVSNLAQGRAGVAEGKGAEGKSWGTPLPPAPGGLAKEWGRDVAAGECLIVWLLREAWCFPWGQLLR